MSELDYIVSNQVECLRCGDKPFSMHRHHFQPCNCGAVTVDGGQDYLKRLGTPSNWKEMSISISRELLQPLIDEVGRSMETRNPLGVTLACLRAIRDAGPVPFKRASGATNWIHEDDVPTPKVRDDMEEYCMSLEERLTILQTKLDKIKKLF